MALNTDICNDALDLVGKLRYSFGGNNIQGGYGDCSDFTQYVFACNGIDIGGNTSAQYTKGTPIKQEDLQAGDLVFFKGTYNSNYVDGVSHVGIYIGNSEFVHLGSGGCKVSNLDSNYYSNHYLDARRISGVSYSGAPIKYEGATENDIAPVLQNNTSGIIRVVVITLLLAGGLGLLLTAVGSNVIQTNLLKGVEL